MRNPILSLLIGLAIAAVGLGFILWARANFDIGMRLGQVSPAVTMPGFIAIAIGLWLALRAFLLGRLRDALLAGEGALARWQVAASEWEAWRAQDAARSASYSTLRNKLRPSAGRPPMEGVPIVFGEKAIVIGRSIVPLNVTGWGPFAIMQLCDVALVEGAFPSLEFSRYITGKNARIEVVRVPIGAAGRSQAQRVAEHFMAAIPQDNAARARGQFEIHFQAQAGDIAGAEAAWRRGLPESFAWLAGLIALFCFGMWSGIADGQRRAPLDPEIASYFLTVGLGCLALTLILATIAWQNRR